MSMTSSKPYLFRALLEWIEDNDMTPHIIVDVMYDNVSVPLEYVNDGQIVLNISSSSIQLYTLDNETLHFSARFNGVAQDIFVPIASILRIYARENGHGMFFEVEDPKPTPPSDTKKQKAKLVKQEQTKPKDNKRDKSHLKVIK